MYEYLAGKFATFPDGVKRTSIIGTVDINNAEYLTWDGTKCSAEDWPQRVVSSASLPSLFYPALIEGHVCTDGGTAMGLDSTSAVKACIDKGFDESQVTLDVILLDRFTPAKEESASKDTVENIMRMHTAKSYWHGLENVIQTQISHPKANYRYVV